MKNMTAFNVRTRRKTAINNPKLIVLSNGKKAVKGIAADDGKTTVFRILSAEEAKDMKD